MHKFLKLEYQIFSRIQVIIYASMIKVLSNLCNYLNEILYTEKKIPQST